MAIESFMLPLIEEIAGRKLPSRTCLSLGYPDLLTDGHADIKEALDADAIKAWHHWPHRVIDTDDFFQAIDLHPVYLDHAIIRGPEVVVDLNSFQSFPPAGLVIDPGTSEHIFNLGNVFRQIAGCIDVGGYVVHTNPINMMNHGFWNFSPTAYMDFYGSNGFSLAYACIMAGPLDNRTLHEISAERWVKRLDADPNTTACVILKREKIVPFTWPLQSKYAANPNLRIA